MKCDGRLENCHAVTMNEYMEGECAYCEEEEMIMQHGTKLERIIFPGANGPESVIAVGVNDVIDISVQMQNGQVAPVPWFEVLFSNGRRQLWNAAHCEGVTLLEDVLEG
jgi:hypothetical protein